MYYRDLQDIPGDRGCVSPGWGPRPPVVSEKFCLGFCKAAVSTFTFAPQACVSLCFHCWKPRKHRKSPNYSTHCTYSHYDILRLRICFTERTKTWPTDTVFTSPPSWGLRNHEENNEG